MTFTDETIEIMCGECSELMPGLQAMAKHIQTTHLEYSNPEAWKKARQWLEDAYEKEEEFLADYYKQRREDPSQ